MNQLILKQPYLPTPRKGSLVPGTCDNNFSFHILQEGPGKDKPLTDSCTSELAEVLLKTDFVGT